MEAPKRPEFGPFDEMLVLAQHSADAQMVPVYLFQWLTGSDFWYLRDKVPAAAAHAYIIFPVMWRPEGARPATPKYNIWPQIPAIENLTLARIAEVAIEREQWLAVLHLDGRPYLTIDPTVLLACVTQGLVRYAMPAHFHLVDAPVITLPAATQEAS